MGTYQESSEGGPQEEDGDAVPRRDVKGESRWLTLFYNAVEMWRSETVHLYIFVCRIWRASSGMEHVKAERDGARMCSNYCITPDIPRTPKI